MFCSRIGAGSESSRSLLRKRGLTAAIRRRHPLRKQPRPVSVPASSERPKAGRQDCPFFEPGSQDFWLRRLRGCPLVRHSHRTTTRGAVAGGRMGDKPNVSDDAHAWVPAAVSRFERPLTLYAARLLGDADRARRRRAGHVPETLPPRSRIRRFSAGRVAFHRLPEPGLGCAEEGGSHDPAKRRSRCYVREFRAKPRRRRRVPATRRSACSTARRTTAQSARGHPIEVSKRLLVSRD